MKVVSKVLGTLLNILLLGFGLFFLVMGLTDLGKDAFGVTVGLGFGLPLLALYVWRKSAPARARRLAAVEEERWRAIRREEEEVQARRESERERRKASVVTTCPHCGAPGRGEVCEYCGMGKSERRG